MEILYGAAEMEPYAKVGGLGDVAGALTRALAARGHRVRALLPVYPSVRRHWETLNPQPAGVLRIVLGGEAVPATLYRATIPQTSVELLLLEQDDLFDRPNPYVDPAFGRDWSDNAERFAYMCHAMATACEAIDWAPEVVHINDYQLGPLALLIKEGRVTAALRRAAVVFSIHNLGYQGLFPLEAEAATAGEALPAAARAQEKAARLAVLARRLGLPPELTAPMKPLEFHGRINFMKAGIEYADLITTVSPTYAREIQTPEHGFGLDGLLRWRADRLVGILNGIDDGVWDPERDALIPYPFGRADHKRKAMNKRRLLEVCHLAPDSDAPLIGMITRLVDQKGLDLFEAVADEFLSGHDVRMVVLGSGQPRYEALVTRLAQSHPRQFAARIGFDEPFAHLIEAGADFFLMPSRYEPCGLNQMYSMRYGTVPIVRATGGLTDTVDDVTEQRGSGRGIVFRDYRPEALRDALVRALAVYQEKPLLRALRGRIMELDFSWRHVAAEYERLYARALAQRA